MSVELRDRGVIAVACECGWDNDGRLVLVDRYATDFPPIPHFSIDAFIEVYRDSGGDPDDRLHECPECSRELDRHACVERQP